jgi:glycine cleavage system H protein
LSNYPTDLQYTRSHEWVRALAGGELEVGITDHAQGALGDLVFVELPAVGRSVAAGAACAVVESVKAASDIYSPVTGIVVATNAELATRPELVNQEPYVAGWLFRVKPSESQLDGILLNAADYEQFAAADSH